MYERIKVVFEEHYNYGKVSKVQKLTGGLVNQSFQVKTIECNSEKKFFLRIYAAGKKESELLYEHGLLHYLKRKGMKTVGEYLPDREGRSYFEEELKGQKYFWAVQPWLEGENLYAWAESQASEKACISAAQAVAELHCLAYDYKQPEACGRIPGIREQIQTFYNDFEEWTEELRSVHSQQHVAAYMNSRLGYLKECIERTRRMFLRDEDFPVTHIHTDVHLGNFKFLQEEVSAFFDFDWAKRDYRLYDIAMICVEICTPWHYKNIGEVNLKKMRACLWTYQSYMDESASPLGVLSKEEIYALPDMMLAGNLFIMHDLFRQVHENHELSDFEYLYYMIHQTACLEWIEENKVRLRQQI